MLYLPNTLQPERRMDLTSLTTSNRGSRRQLNDALTAKSHAEPRNTVTDADAVNAKPGYAATDADATNAKPRHELAISTPVAATETKCQNNVRHSSFLKNSIL